MNVDFLTKRLAAVMEEWPPASTVWHRADGKRGVIVEYAVDCTGSVMIVLDTGVGQNWEKCCPHVLSAKPVPESGDGDEWKEGVEA